MAHPFKSAAMASSKVKNKAMGGSLSLSPRGYAGGGSPKPGNMALEMKRASGGSVSRYASGGKVAGYANGGRTTSKGKGTTVNINIVSAPDRSSPGAAQSPGGPPPVPMGLPAGGPPPGPPKPPGGPGGPGGAPGAGAIPPELIAALAAKKAQGGMPAPGMMKKGGRVSRTKFTGGAGTGVGRLEKAKKA